MIVCKLIGGLGNQMFQYAYAKRMAIEFNDDLCFDINFYNDNVPALFQMNIEERNTTKDVVLNDMAFAYIAEKNYHILQYIIRKLNHEKIGCNLFQRLSRHGYYFNFDPFYYSSVICKKENKYIYGYFQGVEYFETIEKEVKQQFTAEVGELAKKYEDMIKNCNAIAVHIRLGDYQKKKNQYLNVCTDTYYLNGINYIKGKVDNPVFFVFTNDIKAVRKKEYIPRDAIMVNGTKAYEDLMLMKLCKHFVISASTFSWWGSYLSDNDSKITIAPKVWMRTLRDEPAITMRSDMVQIGID